MSKYFKRGDILIIIIVLISAFLLYLPAFIPKNGRIAEITADGSVVNRINLSEVKESYIVNIQGSEILVEPGRIGYLRSDCPGGDCIRFGMLERPGSFAACIPNHTMIRILVNPGQGQGPDALTY